MSAQTALRKLIGGNLPPSLKRTGPMSLPQLLSMHRGDGVGLSVHQTRWSKKGIPGSYYKITRAKLKGEGEKVTGKVWGCLIWKGSLSYNFLVLGT